MIRNIFGVLLFIVFILLLPNVEAVEDDYVFFHSYGSGEQETQIVYYGEYNIILRVFFGNNCSNHTLSVKSPLFTHPIGGMTPDKVDAGVTQDGNLEINRNAQLGHYPITVYLNYTHENTQKISRQFNLTLEYKKSLEITKLKIPKGVEREFLLKIETFVNFDEFKVEFDSDGDIETKKHEIILENISVGNYTFKTKIYKVGTFEGNAQELGYWIIGKVDNRTVEFGEKNIPANIEWGMGEGFIPGFDLIVILIIIFILLIIKRKEIKNY